MQLRGRNRDWIWKKQSFWLRYGDKYDFRYREILEKRIRETKGA